MEVNANKLTLSNARTLVLNADLRPLSFNPLSVWTWEDSINAIFKDKAYVVDNYADLFVHSPSLVFPVPSVIALKDYIYNDAVVRFTKYNIFFRDKFTCLYCAKKFEAADLSFDHVVPRSKGGKTNWTNIVTSCISCNQRKNDRTPEQAGMKLLYKPYAPTHEQFRRGDRLKRDSLHHSWLDYIYYDSELDQD